MAMDRRKFFKSTAGVAVAAAALTQVDMKAWAQEVENVPTEVKRTYCNMCGGACGIEVHIKNGRAWKLTGNPNHSRSRGRLCPRSHAGIYTAYDPNRIKTPLKRVAPGEFEAISWEQATDEIADKLKRILDQHGPESVFFAHHPSRNAFNYIKPFCDALGIATRHTHHAACNIGRLTGMDYTWGANLSVDWANSKYILYIGRNMGGSINMTSHAGMFGRAVESGAKIVCVDPRQSESAALNDWVPIRPGTDLALLLAIMQVLVSENLYDKEFVAEHTIGFERLAAVLPQYTPEWAEPITDIPAAKVREIAHGLADAAPAAAVDTTIKGAFGCNYENSTDTARAMAYVNALLGNINQPGGIAIRKGAKLAKPDFPQPAPAKGPRNDGVGTEFPLALSNGLLHVTMENARKGQVKAGFFHWLNPLRGFPDWDHMLEGMRSMELLVDFETHMSETAMECDYVLPESNYLERDEVVGNWGTLIAARFQAIEKLHPETRGFDEAIQMLAQKLGIGQYFEYTIDEWNEARIANQDFTLAELKERGAMNERVEQPKGMQKLKTPSGKFEFFSQRFEDAGYNGIAEWYPPATGLELNSNEFRIVHGKQPYHTHSSTTRIPMLAQVTKDLDSARVWMNASRAAALGIADGDTVRFTAPDGRGSEARVKVTERIHPDVLFTGGAYGTRTPHFEATKDLGGLSPHDFTQYRAEKISGHTMMSEIIVTAEKV